MAEAFKLANGLEIPRVGISTAGVPSGKTAELVEQAVRNGCRLIASQTDDGTGNGIRESGADPNSVFVITAIRLTDGITRDDVEKAVDAAISAAGTGVSNILLIEIPEPIAGAEHRPFDVQRDREIWGVLEDALDQGKARAIGVSNFLQEDVDNLLAGCRIEPMLNAARIHIGKTPQGLLEFCASKNIRLLAYSPMGEGRLLKDNEIRAIAEKYGVTTAQVCLQYVVQLGAVPLVRAEADDCQKEDLDLRFELSDDEMSLLGVMHEK